jgi:hypothetical protein
VSVQGNERRPTKAERKEQARAEREAIERKQASRNRNRVLVAIAGVVLVAAVIGLVVLLGGNNDTPTGGATASTAPGGLPLPDPATLPGILQTAPPWSDNVAQANQRLAMLGLPELSDTILHLHVRLWIYVDGKPVVVPAGVGYNQRASVFSPLHTHDTTGTVHVESADPNFKAVLGQFMDVWGVYFTPTCLGDRCNDGDNQVRMFVNGQPYVGDPTLLPLEDQSAVVLSFGTEAQLPNPIPDSFTFNANG